MALAKTGGIVVDAPELTDRIAEEDITEVNANGQTVVLVPKGQRIPKGLDQVEAAPTPVKTEDKARRSAKEKAVKPVVDPVE